MALAEFINADLNDQIQAAQELREDLRKRLADPAFYDMIRSEVESGKLNLDTTYAAAHMFQMSKMVGKDRVFGDGIRRDERVLYHHLLETFYNMEDWAGILTSYQIYIIIMQTLGEVASYMNWRNRPELVQ